MIVFMKSVGLHPTHHEPTRAPIDAKSAAEQHAHLGKVAEELGARVELLPTQAAGSDGVCIEETAVLLPEIAIIGRSAEPAKAAEIQFVGQRLGQHRPTQGIVAPGTLDGGDVLRIGRVIYVAESARTNADGIAQLREIVQPYGYEVSTVTMRDCPRLKAACTFVPPHFIVANPAKIDLTPFRTFVVVPIEDQEPCAANTLTVGRTTLVSASAPRTEKRLRLSGVTTRRVDISEFEKAAIGLTNLALVLEPRVAKSAPVDGNVKSIRANGVPSRGAHSPHAVVHDGVVYASPQLPFDPDSKRSRRPSVEEQAEQSMRNLSLVLTAAGSSLNRTLRMTIHLADPKHAPRVESVVGRLLGKHQPACSVVTNAAMSPGVLVQVEGVAAVNEDAG